MGARENKVEKYLDSEVKKLGGLTRKWTCPGHDGVPDRIVITPLCTVFVEVKTVDGKRSSVQIREQTRLKEAGGLVYTVFGEKDVDRLIESLDI